MVELLKVVDDRQRNNGDWRALVYMEQKEKDKVDVVYEALRLPPRRRPEVHDPVHQAQGVGRARATCASTRTCGSTTPASASGSGAPSASASAAPTRAARTSTSRAWPRSTTPTFEGEEKLGAYTAQKLLLKGKPGIDLAFPVIKLWVDKDDEQRPQAAGVRAVGPAAAHVVLPEVEEGLQRVQEGGRLVPAGDPLLRRGGEGELRR